MGIPNKMLFKKPVDLVGSHGLPWTPLILKIKNYVLYRWVKANKPSLLEITLAEIKRDISLNTRRYPELIFNAFRIIRNAEIIIISKKSICSTSLVKEVHLVKKYKTTK